MSEIRKQRRAAFKKREVLMRNAIHAALGKLMTIPDEEGRVAEVGQILAEALSQEAAVVIPVSEEKNE